MKRKLFPATTIGACSLVLALVWMSTPAKAHDAFNIYYQTQDNGAFHWVYPGHDRHKYHHRKYNDRKYRYDHHKHDHHHESVNPCYRHKLSWRVRKACERQYLDHSYHDHRYHEHRREVRGAFYYRDKHRKHHD